MSQEVTNRAPWITAAALALNKHGSWTGRMHLHKHLFVTQVLGLARPPFEFVLYDYGPYSFDLDREIVDLEMMNHLARSYPQPGYGPRYEPTAHGFAHVNSLPESDRDAINRVAKQFGNRKAQDLELIATCLWVERKEDITDDDALVTKIQKIKPKYDEPTIRDALANARALRDALMQAPRRQ